MNPTPSLPDTPTPRELSPARRQIGTVALAIAFIFACSLLLQVIAVAVLNELAPDLKYQPWFAVAFFRNAFTVSFRTPSSTYMVAPLIA